MRGPHASLLLLSIVLTMWPTSASARVINVGPRCSLASAIIAANIDQPFGGCFTGFGVDEIRIPAGTVTTLVQVDHAGPGGSGATGLPSIRSPIIIRPTGSTDVATIARIGAAPDFRVFQVESGGDLTLQRLVIRGGRLSGTTADDRGACLEARPGSVRVVMDEVTFEGCAAAADVTAVFSRAGETRIQRSAFLGSRALSGGAVSAVRLGGLSDLSNCTFSDNDGVDLLQAGGQGTLTHCTLFDGAATPAMVEASLSATLRLRNTLLVGATQTTTMGVVTLEGVNLVDPTAALAPLADNGGLSLSHLPMNRGPAIDVADTAFCPFTDQRRVRRPQGSACDLGAVEREAPVLESCGNGAIDPPEECDDGMETASCDSDCSFAICGDATLNRSAGEACDDGVATPFCNADCSRPICGDRVVSAAAGEQCDDGMETNSCDVDCTIAECGDRVINATAGEQCDDGNVSDNDGCSRRCRTEGDAGRRRDAGSFRVDAGGAGDPDAGPDPGEGGCSVGRRPRGALGLVALMMLAHIRRRRR